MNTIKYPKYIRISFPIQPGLRQTYYCIFSGIDDNNTATYISFTRYYNYIIKIKYKEVSEQKYYIEFWDSPHSIKNRLNNNLLGPLYKKYEDKLREITAEQFLSAHMYIQPRNKIYYEEAWEDVKKENPLAREQIWHIWVNELSHMETYDKIEDKFNIYMHFD